MYRITLFLVLLLSVITSSIYPQSTDAYQSLFKLGSTPFINKSKINAGLSYGINYGSPSTILQRWILPDFNKDIMFSDIKGYLSFGPVAEVYLKYTEGHSFAYNSSYLGEDRSTKRYNYGIKYKFIESGGYVPDAAVEINSEYPVSLSAGSADEAFKYYVCVDFGYFYFLLPRRYSAGAAYTLMDNVSLFAETNYEAEWDTQTRSYSVRTGIDLSLYNYVHLDLALFYFNFRFRDIIPGRTGFTWEDPGHLLTMPEKNKYYLLSSSITINLDILK
ncbi:MAG TPA: hypothetical protein VKD08_13325 [Ignavibacteriaceae bacterium]|nr:hypothetical protein [Ignavibacteriaceae bacterium]